jgi:hypothetical protein
VKVSSLNSNEIFKNWLKDTLVNLAIWKQEKEMNIAKKEILISKDSLSLTTNVYYLANISLKEKQTGDISNMIDLFKEYDELPKKDFKLSFLYQMFYYPSTVEQLKYDFIYEIKEVEIVEDDSKSKFTVTRGRLNRKEVESKNINGKKEVIETDFIWNGDILEKKVVK